MLDGTFLECLGALLFCLVFIFLWRQSGVRYFGYWALAWAVESIAWSFTILEQAAGSSRWSALHSFFEIGFALSLVAAARAGTPDRAGTALRSAVRILYFFPVFLLVLELVGGGQRDMHNALRALVLSAIYLYNFRQLGLGGRRLFHFTLLALSCLYLQSAGAYLYVMLQRGVTPVWLGYMQYVNFYDVGLKTMLAFAAMAMWIESQNDRMVQIGSELDRVRREIAHESNLDRLTGLLNQDSLQHRMDLAEAFHGVAAVCDLDDFKSVNDCFGHTVGDEVLRNVGSLLRSSIRAEDQAYRWGGDEFAILFNERETKPARERMLEIEAKFSNFRVRGHSSLLIRFSWGVAEGSDDPLREVLARADREMYAKKRERALNRGALPTT